MIFSQGTRFEDILHKDLGFGGVFTGNRGLMTFVAGEPEFD